MHVRPRILAGASIICGERIPVCSVRTHSRWGGSNAETGNDKSRNDSLSSVAPLLLGQGTNISLCNGPLCQAVPGLSFRWSLASVRGQSGATVRLRQIDAYNRNVLSYPPLHTDRQKCRSSGTPSTTSIVDISERGVTEALSRNGCKNSMRLTIWKVWAGGTFESLYIAFSNRIAPGGCTGFGSPLRGRVRCH